MRSRSPRRTNKTINVRECKKKRPETETSKKTRASHTPQRHINLPTSACPFAAARCRGVAWK